MRNRMVLAFLLVGISIVIINACDTKTQTPETVEVSLNECPRIVSQFRTQEGLKLEQEIEVCFLWNYGLSRAAGVADNKWKNIIQEDYVRIGTLITATDFMATDILKDEDKFKRSIVEGVKKEIDTSNDRAYLMVEEIKSHEITYPLFFLEEVLEKDDISPAFREKIIKEIEETKKKKKIN